MKKQILSCLALSVLLLPASWSVQAQGETATIACVDMQKVFQNYFKTQETGVTLKKDVKKYRRKAQRMMSKIKSLRSEYQKLKRQAENVGLTEAQKEESAKKAKKKEAQLKKHLKQFKDFRSKNKEKLDKQYMKKRNRILSEIVDVVRAYADKHEIDLVIDTSGMTSNMIPTVVHAADKLKITDAILTKLNEKKPEKGSVDNEKAGDVQPPDDEAREKNGEE